jgi:hypothetical protein
MTSNSGPAATVTANYQAVLNLSRGYQLLFRLSNANLRTTQDQKFTRVFNGVTWDPQLITAVWRSGAYNTACLGGIFTLPSKGGSAIVAVGQSYAALTGVDTHANLTIQASTTTFRTDPYFSLSTANGADLFADLFIWGVSYDTATTG